MRIEGEQISAIIQNCLRYIEKEKYFSFDPYDALTNPLVNYITFPFSFLRRVAIQINSRSPFDMHWTGMKKMIHTKTLTDLLYYYSLKMKEANSSTEVAEPDKQKFNLLYDILTNLKIPDIYAWGLNYPYTSRFINADRNMPNLYNTVNSGISICYSLPWLDTDNKEKALNVLKGLLEFLNTTMWFTDNNGQGWYQYYPGQNYPTYNVNALALYLLVLIQNRVGVPDSGLENKIMALIDLLCEDQKFDGSWTYARSVKGNWIDGFHTGFIIESIAFAKKEGINSSHLELALSRGIDYYVNNFFTNDFFVKYFPNSTMYPMDAQNYAQAIQTLSVLGYWGIWKDESLLKNVISNSVKHLYNEKGFFYYRKTKLYTIKTPYFRWSVTPMILALEYANHYLAKR